MNSNDVKPASKIYNRIKFSLENVLFVLFALMVVIVFINVVARFVFNTAITSSEEIARFCLIWLVYIGAALALAENEHLGFDIVVNLLPESMKKWVAVLAHLFMALMTVIMTVYGFKLALTNIKWPSPATGIPYGVINLILPFSAAFMLIVIIKNLVLLIKNILKK